jgi:hypothetical protein
MQVRTMKIIRSASLLSLAFFASTLLVRAQDSAQKTPMVADKPVAASAEGKAAACQHGDAKSGDSCCTRMNADSKDAMSCCAHHDATMADNGAMSCGKHGHEMASDGKAMSCCHHAAAQDGEHQMGCCAGKDTGTKSNGDGKDGKSCCESSKDSKTMTMACCSNGHCGMDQQAMDK